MESIVYKESFQKAFFKTNNTTEMELTTMFGHNIWNIPIPYTKKVLATIN